MKKVSYLWCFSPPLSLMLSCNVELAESSVYRNYMNLSNTCALLDICHSVDIFYISPQLVY